MHDVENECTVNLVLLWLSHVNSSGTQKGECPPLEADTRGLVRANIPRKLSTRIVNCEV
jgi:hypothetical protein